MMAQYMSSVSVLHCGGDEEVHFIEYLEKALASHQGPCYALEYTKFQQRQAKDTIMYNDALRYKKEKVPLIVLISKSFFDLIWITSYKHGILNVLTNYSTRNCLHIWMDVSDALVKCNSVALCRTDGHFRKVKAPELTTALSPADMVVKIQGLLNVNGDGRFDPLNNYSVDNEEAEMRKNFEILTFGKELQPQASAAPSIPAANVKTKKSDVYKDALRMAYMTNEELAASGLVVDTTPQNTPSNNTKKKRKNQKKRGNTDTIMLLTDLTEKDKKHITNSLDKGAGANWKQLAESFNFSPTLIRKMNDSPPHESQTEKLIEVLKKDQPELEMIEFMQKCKQIMRSDVQAYIMNNILN